MEEPDSPGTRQEDEDAPEPKLAEKGLYVLCREGQGLKELDSFKGSELVILVVVDPSLVASSFDDDLKRLERKAGEASRRLEASGVKVRTVVEWGDKTESVANALQREKARLLNKD